MHKSECRSHTLSHTENNSFRSTDRILTVRSFFKSILKIPISSVISKQHIHVVRQWTFDRYQQIDTRITAESIL